LLRRHGPKMQCAISFVINGVRCQPRRSKKATWDDLIEVGNAGWRVSDAVAPSFLVRVRVGQSQRDAVEQHPNKAKFEAAVARAGAEAGAGAAGCKLSKSAGGEAGKADREAGGADDAMDLEGDEAGGEANAMVVADLIGREADGSEDCGAHYGEDTELGHVRRELFAELGEVGANAAAAAATAVAAAASAASAAATAPTEPPPLPERAWKSIVLVEYNSRRTRGAGLYQRQCQGGYR